MTRLYLIRHGETDWNRQGRWQGQADVPLNDCGRQQARQVAEKLAEVSFDAIYTSDLIRASEVARIIARAKGDRIPIVLEPRLREIHQGEWQGLLVQEIQSRYAEAFRQQRVDPSMVAAPGGETALQVRQRALQAVRDLLAAYPHGNVALVSHGFTIAVLLTYFYRLPMEKVWELVPENGAIIEMDANLASLESV